jgi:cardiolipin synthase C
MLEPVVARLYWRIVVSIAIFAMCASQPAAIATGEESSLAADQARLLADDADALGTRLSLIRGAASRISVSSYLIGDDGIAILLLDALGDAAKRGIDVQVLVDGSGDNNQIPNSVLASLRRSGVRVKMFLPARAGCPEWSSRRMHDKLFIVDGERLVMGGRNLRGDYFGGARVNFVDRDVLIHGMTARYAQRYFDELWRSCRVGPLESGCEGRGGMAATCDKSRPNWPADDVDPGDSVRSAQGELEAIGPTRFLCDPPDQPKTGLVGIGPDLTALLERAQCSVVLETPYAVLSARMRQVIQSLRKRGVRVTLITNSLRTTDHTTAYAAYMNQRRGLLADGVEIWELRGDRHLHAKAALVDGQISVLGSYNYDLLSERRNTEVAVVIYDHAFASRLSCSLQSHLDMCRRINPDGRPVGSQVRHPGVERDALQQLRCLRIVAPLIKGHL